MLHKDADSALIVFLRLPEKGKVKTRIASTAGDEQALAIYTQLVAITYDLLAQLNIPIYLFFEGGLPDQSERNAAYTYLVQCKGNLGQKMEDAFSLVLGHHSKAVLIGSDCPEITTAIITEAISLLDTNDIVLGPASDGGYYLIGCKKAYPVLFERIDWSTSTVLRSTIEKIQNSDLSYHLLEQLTDIDTATDWERYALKNPEIIS